MADLFLNEGERNYLRGLQGDPRWFAILRKLTGIVPPPRFKPGRDSAEQHDLWIYQSGQVDMLEAVVSLMAGRNVTINLQGPDLTREESNGTV